jgi:ubiquitin carboxyl-terminal hydrolase 7
VKGCKNVYESFDKYVEVERLEGENKYQAEQFGLQVGSSFKSPLDPCLYWLFKSILLKLMPGLNMGCDSPRFLQDAKKGVLFMDFPPVLQLQLKRFEYDFMRDTMVKVKKLLMALYSGS